MCTIGLELDLNNNRRHIGALGRYLEDGRKGQVSEWEQCGSLK